jgi:hypothetical protein
VMGRLAAASHGMAGRGVEALCYIGAHTHSHTHAHTRAHARTHTHTHTLTCTHPRICIYLRTIIGTPDVRIHSFGRSGRRPCSSRCVHTHTCTRAQEHTHTHTHTHTHKPTHTHTNTLRGALQRMRMRPGAIRHSCPLRTARACARASALVFVRVCIRLHAGVRIVSDHAVLRASYRNVLYGKGGRIAQPPPLHHATSSVAPRNLLRCITQPPPLRLAISSVASRNILRCVGGGGAGRRASQPIAHDAHDGTAAGLSCTPRTPVAPTQLPRRCASLLLARRGAALLVALRGAA